MEDRKIEKAHWRKIGKMVRPRLDRIGPTGVIKKDCATQEARFRDLHHQDRLDRIAPIGRVSGRKNDAAQRTSSVRPREQGSDSEQRWHRAPWLKIGKMVKMVHCSKVSRSSWILVHLLVPPGANRKM